VVVVDEAAVKVNREEMVEEILVVDNPQEEIQIVEVDKVEYK